MVDSSTHLNTSYASVKGEQITKIPEDLYIPPDALNIFLETFEGPLDLLLYLIKKQNIDILDIPIAKITEQYVAYINLMKELCFELAGDYLVMAAMLAEIKSRMLLPKHPEIEGEEDPRADLIRRLQEYEQYKFAAESLDNIPRKGRDTFVATANMINIAPKIVFPNVDLRDLLMALQDVLKRSTLKASHHISYEPLSVRERMSKILASLSNGKFVDFQDCFDVSEGRIGIVVTFIAILELIKEMAIDIVQSEPFSPIYIKVIS